MEITETEESKLIQKHSMKKIFKKISSSNSFRFLHIYPQATQYYSSEIVILVLQSKYMNYWLLVSRQIWVATGNVIQPIVESLGKVGIRRKVKRGGINSHMLKRWHFYIFRTPFLSGNPVAPANYHFPESSIVNLLKTKQTQQLMGAAIKATCL